MESQTLKESKILKELQLQRLLVLVQLLFILPLPLSRSVSYDIFQFVMKTNKIFKLLFPNGVGFQALYGMNY